MSSGAQQAQPVAQIKNLSFCWSRSSDPVLTISDWQVYRGERWCIYGPSGSGKTTLLNLLTGLLMPTQGTISILGEAINNLNGARRDRLRADHLGYIFQQFNLLPYLSVFDNVCLPVQLSTPRKTKSLQHFASIEAEAEHWLGALDLPQDRWHQSVLQLSIGQQQRVAGARALMGAPELIIADEPTSALDVDNAKRFIEAFNHACQEQQTALIMVSHDQSFHDQFDQLWALDQEAR
ncbi:MAG: ATP-binding cassette domain-containing protein [Reinekea sp.]|jgi:putative ABC transport system ATP-binding protein